jgi:hypothetical protein
VRPCATAAEVKIDEFLAAATKENHCQYDPGIRCAAQREMQLPPALQAMLQTAFNTGLQQCEQQTPPNQRLHINAHYGCFGRIA